MAPARASRQAFLGASSLIFAGSATVTIVACMSMSGVGVRTMPGGWTMSMAWMRMPGQSWPGAAASFLGMWVAMMVAMMLPASAPALWRYRQAVDDLHIARPGRLTLVAGIAYFLVWTAVGMAVFPFGVALTTIEMRMPALARAVPLATGVVVLLAGAIQFSAWKSRHLACCLEVSWSGRDLRADAGAAWQYGLRLGVHCICCGFGLMAILLAIAVMDLRTMAVVTAAMTLERVAPNGARVAKAIGLVAVGAGCLMIMRAAFA